MKTELEQFIYDFKFEEEPNDKNWLYSEIEVHQLLKECGKQQWNEAIKLAAENITAYSSMPSNDNNALTSSQSILKLLK